jgi:hypothetical protein
MNGPEHGPAPKTGLGAMLADVLAGVTRLVQGELALARAEAADRLDALRRAMVQLVVAAVLGVTAINLLAAAAVAAVARLGLGPAWASVMVGGIVLLLALGVAGQASRLLRQAGKAPGRSAASIKRDFETLQTMVRHDAPA